MGTSIKAIDAAERLLETLQHRSDSEQALIRVPGLLALIRDALPALIARAARNRTLRADHDTDLEALTRELSDGLCLDYQLELARWFGDRCDAFPPEVTNALQDLVMALEAAADAHLALQSAICAADLQQDVA